MFTGIIHHCGVIRDLVTHDHAMTLWIQTQFNDLELGESIAVDGICLTVSEIADDGFRCDLSPETVSVTAAKYFEKNKHINLERALLASDRLGGHFVLGHVDEVCQVQAINKYDEYTKITFKNFSPQYRQYLMSKGSVTINGVSLTLNHVSDTHVDVMLIPTTLETTNLSELTVGQSVNIEYDYLAKIISNQVKLSRDNI